MRCSSARRVTTRYGGNFVQSIDGLGRDATAGRDWFFYVNGILADKSATTIKRAAATASGGTTTTGVSTTCALSSGRIPEPFLHGAGRQAIPGRAGMRRPRRRLRHRNQQLAEAGVPASRARAAAQHERTTLRVLVGPWPRVGRDFAPPGSLTRARASGVYARLRRRRRRLRCSTRRGTQRRRRGHRSGRGDGGHERRASGSSPGSTRRASAAPAALTERRCHGQFAVAVTPTVAGRLPLAR